MFLNKEQEKRFEELSDKFMIENRRTRNSFRKKQLRNFIEGGIKVDSESVEELFEILEKIYFIEPEMWLEQMIESFEEDECDYNNYIVFKKEKRTSSLSIQDNMRSFLGYENDTFTEKTVGIKKQYDGMLYVDDIIGTGSTLETAIKKYKKLMEINEKRKLKDEEIKIVVKCCVIYEKCYEELKRKYSKIIIHSQDKISPYNIKSEKIKEQEMELKKKNKYSIDLIYSLGFTSPNNNLLITYHNRSPMKFLFREFTDLKVEFDKYRKSPKRDDGSFKKVDRGGIELES